MIKQITVSIIGGGHSGLCSVDSLLDAFTSIDDVNLTIRLFEKTPTQVIGPAIPYDMKQP